MLTTNMLENITNHKKSKITYYKENTFSKQNIQYEFFNECSLFSSSCIETIQCPKEVGNESDKIFPDLCIIRHDNDQTLLQIQCEPKIIPVAEISTNRVLLNDSNIVSVENGKCIEFAIRIYIDYDDHFKTLKTLKNKIPTSLEKNIDSSSIILPINHVRIFMHIAEKNLKYSINSQVLIVMKIIEIIYVHKSTVESLVPKTALCPMFSKWYFQNIAQGLRLKSVLRNININAISIIRDILCLILREAFTSSNVTVTITFIHVSSVPLEEYRDLIYCMRLISNTKCVTTDDEPIVVIEPIRNIVKEEKAIRFPPIEVSHQSTQTTRTKKYKNVDTSTEFKREREIDDIKVHEKHSLHSLNPSIWLPKLCGDSCNNKINFMSYILKCSCLNEALVNLDVAEKYIKTIYDIVLSPTFNKVFLKDLGTALVSNFINSVI